MLQYIFFIYNSIIKECNEYLNNKNHYILYQTQKEIFLEKDFTKKMYNSEYFGQDDTIVKTRVRKKICMSFHPCKKFKNALNEFESYIPLDLSNKATNLVQKLEENSQNVMLKNKNEKSLSESNTSTLQNFLEITFKHSDAGDKKDSEKTSELLIIKNSLDIIADEILNFQKTLLENNKKETFHNMDVLQKIEELQKSYQTKDLNEKLSALNFFIEKEFVYDKQFIINFLKTYSESELEKNYYNSRCSLFRWIKKTRSILSSSVPNLIKSISELSLEVEKKDYLLFYIKIIKISLEHIMKLIPNYRLQSDNIAKLLYWYMRFINEKNILDNLFDLVGLQNAVLKKNIPFLLTNDDFYKFSNCLNWYYLNIEIYAKTCIVYILG